MKKQPRREALTYVQFHRGIRQSLPLSHCQVGVIIYSYYEDKTYIIYEVSAQGRVIYGAKVRNVETKEVRTMLSEELRKCVLAAPEKIEVHDCD